MTRSSFAYRVRHLFVPMLVVAPAFVAGYTILDWLLVTGTRLLPLDEELVTLWLPGALAIAAVAAFLSPYLRVFLRDARHNTPFLYGMIAAALIALPAVLAQLWLSSFAGSIAHVANAGEIAARPPAKYYIADTICLAKDDVTGHATSEFVGEHDDEIAFTLYLAVPVCGAANSDVHVARTWIAIKYTKRIDGHGADEEAAYKIFLRESEARLNKEDPARWRFLETAGRNADRRNFQKALQRGQVTVRDPILLIPHAEPFDERTGTLLPWTLGTLGGGLVLWFLLILLPSVDPARATMPRARADFGWSFFMPGRRNYGLPLLIDINVLVYFLMVLSGLGVMAFDTDDLIPWGALYGPAMEGFGALRLISCQFVHGGLMHILSNMYGLLFAGLFLGPIVRNARLIVCYLVCGTAGAVTSLTVHPEIVSVGASGAIMGLCGILLVLDLLRDKRLLATRRAILINVGLMVLLTLSYGAESAGVDNAAHLGGLAAGIVVGLTLYFLPPQREDDPTGDVPVA